MKLKPIQRLLVANRGEIASRIFRTARSMGIETIAVYADGDARAPFVRAADHAIALQGHTPTETYLNAEKILEAGSLTNADAVHPGYGFLSENADFANAVLANGFTWIGPPVSAIEQMGDKLTAKSTMINAGIPTLKAVKVAPEADVPLVAKEIGYPILVKATAGGGGRGMRVVEHPDQLLEAIESAQREAQSAFGNATVFLERWITQTRHIEVQILGDVHGNVVHLFERECSIQRRHQKIIEEAPSSAIAPKLREKLGDAAVSVAKALEYSSAGTVEFLVSGDDYWFLEVNTRLQVEHPITEAITGFDLVREQLRVAEGEALGYTQQDVSITGHAIEARLYAEDPKQDFLPSSGIIKAWKPAPHIRFDSGVETGSVVNIEFDPMIAKVIAHGHNRPEANRKLIRALEMTHIQGIKHNRDFLVQTLKSEEFQTGNTTTDFIERVAPTRERKLTTEELNDILTAVVLYSQQSQSFSKELVQPMLKSQLPAQHHALKFGEEDYDVKCDFIADREFQIVIGRAKFKAKIVSVDESHIDLEIGKRRLRFDLWCEEDRWYVHTSFGDVEISNRPMFSVEGTSHLKGNLSAPMPGKVVSLNVANGTGVKSGQLLMVLEAMKMEHRIVAPYDGVISTVHVSIGDLVEKDVLLVEMENPEHC